LYGGGKVCVDPKLVTRGIWRVFTGRTENKMNNEICQGELSAGYG
jgi:hypothetical protein